MKAVYRAISLHMNEAMTENNALYGS